MADKSKLSEQQVRFCYEYTKDLNGKQAAIRAGYSPKTAESQGSRLLSKVKVQEKIYQLNQERIEEVRIDSNFVLKELYKIASSDLSGMFREDGSIKPIHDWPEELRKAASGVEVIEYFEGMGGDREQVGQIKKVRMWSKDKALENLGKHLKLFTDKVEHSADDSLENLIAASFKK